MLKKLFAISLILFFITPVFSRGGSSTNNRKVCTKITSSYPLHSNDNSSNLIGSNLFLTLYSANAYIAGTHRDYANSAGHHNSNFISGVVIINDDSYLASTGFSKSKIISISYSNGKSVLNTAAGRSFTVNYKVIKTPNPTAFMFYEEMLSMSSFTSFTSNSIMINQDSNSSYGAQFTTYLKSSSGLRFAGLYNGLYYKGVIIAVKDDVKYEHTSFVVSRGGNISQRNHSSVAYNFSNPLHILDAVAPTIVLNTLDMVEDSAGSSFLHYATINGVDTQYFNPLESTLGDTGVSNLTLRWYQAEDKASGKSIATMVKNIYFPMNSEYLSSTTTSRTFPCSWISSSQLINVLAVDYVDNVGSSGVFNFVKDTALPSININGNVTYAKVTDGDEVSYSVKIPYKVSDAASGIPEFKGNPLETTIGKVNPDDVGDRGELVYVDKDDSAGTIGSYVPVWARDVEYHIKSSIVDNVSNKKGFYDEYIMLSHNARIDAGEDVTYKYDSTTGALSAEGYILLGPHAKHALGIEKVNISVLDETGSSKVSKDFVLSTIELKNSDHEVNGIAGNKGKKFKFNIPLDKSTFSVNKAYKFKVTTVHKTVHKTSDGTYTRSVPNDETIHCSKAIPLNPNDPFGTAEFKVNTATFKIKEDNGDLNYNKYTGNIETEINKQLNNYPFTIKSLGDLTDYLEDGSYTVGKEIQVPNKTGLYYQIYSPEGDEYFYLALIYKYTQHLYNASETLYETDEKKLTYLYNKFKIQRDVTLNISELSIITSQDDVVTTDLNREAVKLKTNKVPEDVSGIDSIIYFNYAGASFPDLSNDTNFNNLEELYKKLGYVEVNPYAQGYVHGYSDLTLTSVAENTVVDRYIGVRIRDRAGNIRYIGPKKVNVDKVPPANYTEDNFTYTYDIANNKVILDLDDSYPDELKQFNNGKYELVSGNVVNYPLTTGYTPNSSFVLKLRLEDQARNVLDKDLIFYRPGRILNTDIKYTNSYSSDNGNTVTFDKNGLSTEFSNYVIKRVESNGSETELTGKVDNNLISHADYKYNIYSVNGSGYTNLYNTYYTKDYPVYITNNLSVIEITNDFVYKDSNIYLKPGYEITYNKSDVDNDTLNSVIKVAGTTLEADIEDATSFTLEGLYGSLLSEKLEDNKPYTINIEVTDSWVKPGSSDVTLITGDTVTEPINFIYDSTPPELVSYVIEKDENYPAYNGDLYLNIQDSGVGIDETTVIATIDNGVAPYTLAITRGSYTRDGKTYTHYLELPEGHYDLIVNASDRLGTSSELLNEPVVVDKTPAVISKVEWGNNSNLIGNLLSTVNSNFSIYWSDNETKPYNLTYEFVDLDGSVVDSGVKKVDGFTSLNGGEFSVNLTNSGKDLVDNRAYTLNIALYDSAGNLSLEASPSFSILYDLNAPELMVSNWNINNVGGVNYINANSSLVEPSYTITDKVDNSIVPTYKLYSFKTDQFTEEYTDINDIVIPEDGEYEIYIVAKDDSGHTSSDKASFIYDTNGPTELGFAFASDKKNAYFGGESLTIAFNGNDVEKYIYKLVDSITGNDVTNGWIEVPVGKSNPYTLTLPRIDGVGNQVAILKLMAEDIAGNQSGIIVPVSGNITIDNTTECINVSVTPWVGKSGNISGVWTYNPGIDNDDKDITGYKYRVLRDRSGEVKSLTPGYVETVETSCNYTIEEEIIEGDKYFIEVTGILLSSRETSPFRSVYALNDFIYPQVDTIITDEYSTTSNLEVNYTVSDNRDVSTVKAQVSWSYLENEELKIGTGNIIPLGSSLTGDIDLSNELEKHPVDTGYFVYVDIIVEDLAGNITSRRSDSIIIDNTPPPAFGIVDLGDYINPLLNQSMVFNWTWSEDDSDSPIVKTMYQLTEAGVINEANWIELIGNIKEKDVVIPEEYKVLEKNGSTLILAVKKENAAGLSTIGFSNGITMDSTAGIINSARFVYGSTGNEVLYYTDDLNININIDGEDPQSGIARVKGELGSFVNGEWLQYESGEFDLESENTLFSSTLPDSFPENTRFAYKLVWYNGSGVASEPIYTRELVYAPFEPEVTNLRGEYSNKKIKVKWDSIFYVPFETGELKLVSDGVLKEYQISKNNNEFVIDTTGLLDGEYKVVLNLFDVAGKPRPAKNINSNSFIIDTVAPVVKPFNSDTHVSYYLDFNLETDEAIRNYSYSIGLVDDMDNWISGLAAGESLDIDNINLRDFVNIDDLHNTYIELKVKVSDRYGNWSIENKTLVRVDLTPPAVPSPTVDRKVTFKGKDIVLDKSISFSRERVDNLLWNSSDNESGIVGYKVAILNSADEEITEDKWSRLISVDNSGSYRVSVDEASSESRSLYIALKVLNRADLYSYTGYSDEIFIDLDAPVTNFTMVGEDATTVIDGVSVSTYNDNGNVKFQMDNEVSENSFVEINVYDPNNKLISKYETYLDKDTRFKEFELLKDLELYGLYRIEANVTDPGGNNQDITKVVRYNSPPFGVYPEEIRLNPLRPYTLPGSSWFTDSDGVADISYRVVEEGVTLYSQSGLDNKTIALNHKNIWDQESIYSLNVVATDSLGAFREITIPLKVVNTQSGDLYTDEYWSGTHVITGDIRVPVDIKLTVQDGTNIVVDCGALYGEGQTITIEGELDHIGTATYSDDEASRVWGGFRVKGICDLSNITINGAERGVVLNTTNNVDITDLTASDNKIGVHLLNAGSVTISNSTFTDNRHYGIKEEPGVNPVVTNSYFRGNGYDYYDTEQTVLDFEKLNSLDSNNGNRGE